MAIDTGKSLRNPWCGQLFCTKMTSSKNMNNFWTAKSCSIKLRPIERKLNLLSESYNSSWVYFCRLSVSLEKRNIIWITFCWHKSSPFLGVPHTQKLTFECGGLLKRGNFMSNRGPYPRHRCLGPWSSAGPQRANNYRYLPVNTAKKFINSSKQKRSIASKNSDLIFAFYYQIRRVQHILERINLCI